LDLLAVSALSACAPTVDAIKAANKSAFAPDLFDMIPRIPGGSLNGSTERPLSFYLFAIKPVGDLC
jgi:hypothetical protein